MALAVIATYFAASRPAKAIAKTPIVAALAGRPPALKKTRHLAIPVGLGFLVGAFLLLGMAGASGGNGNGMLEVVVGFVALAVAIVLLAPSLLEVVAAAGKHAPIAAEDQARGLATHGGLAAAAAPNGPLEQARLLAAQLQTRQLARQRSARVTARSASRRDVVLVAIAAVLALIGAIGVITLLVSSMRGPLDALVSAAIAETGAKDPKDMGQVMKAVMAKVDGRADGRRVSGRVREVLSGSRA